MPIMSLCIHLTDIFFVYIYTKTRFSQQITIAILPSENFRIIQIIEKIIACIIVDTGALLLNKSVWSTEINLEAGSKCDGAKWAM